MWIMRLKKGLIKPKLVSKNTHKLSLKIGVSYTTTLKYINHPEGIEVLDLRIFAGMLTHGLGLTREQALDLRFGDVFDFEEVEDD